MYAAQISVGRRNGNNAVATRLERLLAIEDMIRKERYPSVDRLCDEFEVKARTVYEDLRMLREMRGLKILFDRARNGYYNSDPKQGLPSFELTQGEVFALTLGKEMLSQYTGTGFEPVLTSAIEKIVERLPDKIRMDVSDLKSAVMFDPVGVVPISRKMFCEMNAACEKHRCVDLKYYAASRDEVTERRVDPYKLLEHRDTWYLLAYCHTRKALRLFALHRVKEYTVTEEGFVPSEDIKADDWLELAFLLEHKDEEQRVKVHFGPVAARYIRERKWHSQQVLTEYPDGSCTLEFPSRSIDEAKRWVLAYGAEAEVLEPETVRNAVKEELKSAFDRYSKE
jgi:predicted DNA-binding transcriptional regulator YafY